MRFLPRIFRWCLCVFQDLTRQLLLWRSTPSAQTQWSHHFQLALSLQCSVSHLCCVVNVHRCCVTGCLNSVLCVVVYAGPDHLWGWWGWSLRSQVPVEARTARYNENLQSRTRTRFGPKISREKICGLLKLFGLLKFFESDALVDNLNVWRTYVVFYIFRKKKPLLYVNMYEGPAVAFKRQGPEGPWCGPEFMSVCLFVCLCPLIYFRNQTSRFHQYVLLLLLFGLTVQ